MNRKTLLIAGLALAASHLQAQSTNSAYIRTVGDYMASESNWLDWLGQYDFHGWSVHTNS
jgi:hypothetical protein